jgi:hypothetical protein
MIISLYVYSSSVGEGGVTSNSGSILPYPDLSFFVFVSLIYCRRRLPRGVLLVLGGPLSCVLILLDRHILLFLFYVAWPVRRLLVRLMVWPLVGWQSFLNCMPFILIISLIPLLIPWYTELWLLLCVNILIRSWWLFWSVKGVRLGLRFISFLSFRIFIFFCFWWDRGVIYRYSSLAPTGQQSARPEHYMVYKGMFRTSPLIFRRGLQLVKNSNASGLSRLCGWRPIDLTFLNVHHRTLPG